MGLVEEALKYLKGKQVIIVTGLDSEGYLQEIAGVFIDGTDGCLVVQQGDESLPTLINAAYVAWIYEEADEEDDEEEEEEYSL